MVHYMRAQSVMLIGISSSLTLAAQRLGNRADSMSELLIGGRCKFDAMIGECGFDGDELTSLNCRSVAHILAYTREIPQDCLSSPSSRILCFSSWFSRVRFCVSA